MPGLLRFVINGTGENISEFGCSAGSLCYGFVVLRCGRTGLAETDSRTDSMKLRLPGNGNILFPIRKKHIEIAGQKGNGFMAENRSANTHPKLPAGFGSIRYLGGERSNPYAVYPTSKGNEGKRIKALCYVPEWHIGVAVLAAWNAGQYEPGLANRLCAEAGCLKAERAAVTYEARDAFCARMLGYFRAFLPSGRFSCTMREGYESYIRYKYGESAPRKLSASSKKHDAWAFGKFASLEHRQLDSITVDELQQVIDRIGLKRSAVGRALTLVKGIYRHALSRECCTRNPAQYVRMPAVKESARHQDFTDGELKILWAHWEDPLVRMILIMCYSGFRWSAYLDLETDLEKGFFRGGVKTDAGRNRIVPIHSAIRPLVEKTLKFDGRYHCGLSQTKFIRRMEEKMAELGIDGNGRHHTPHSCRHTFSRLCESYGVREADRKRMMGHSFGKDITNGVYGHRTLEELRAEIEKIRVPQV